MAASDTEYIKIEVAYADARQVHVQNLEVTSGSTVRQVIELSGMLSFCPEIDLGVNKVGIFSELCTLDTAVSVPCRIEIYRPLIADPRAARRKRAQPERP